MGCWQRVRVCPACGSERLRRFATLRFIPHSRCRACGFTFANPLPSSEFIGGFYNSDFYSNYRQFELNQGQRDRYFSISMYRDIRTVAAWLADRIVSRSSSILDFGCGPGAFIGLLRDEFGFQNVEGLEINRDSATVAKRLHDLTIKSSIAELDHAEYDLVLLVEVIEHIPDPGSLIQQLSALVKPGGRLFITTPSIGNVVGRVLPSHGPHYVAPNHVSMFTMDALQHLLARFGFEIESAEKDMDVALLQTLATIPFYDLDFLSPRNDDDPSDVLYMPTALGRRLGLTPRRWPVDGSIVGRLIGFCARLDRHLRARVPWIPKDNHLYVLARKSE